MKTIALSLSICFNLILVAAIIGCNKSAVDADVQNLRSNGDIKHGTPQGGEPTTFCTNCAVDNLPGEPAAEFANVVARYRDNHQKLFNAFAKNQLNNSVFPNTGTQVGTLFQDTRSCMFDLDRIKKFICLTERHSAAIGLTSQQLGLRFYYGIYPSSYTSDPRYSNMHTLYITATYRDNAGQYRDFDPRRSALAGSIVPLQNLILSNDPDMLVLGGRSAFPTPTGAALNHGDLCPPGNGCDPTLNAVDMMAPNRPLDPIFSY
jgi:hypothetical protein